MRTLTLEELGRELQEKEWTLESKHEYEAAILIEMEKAVGFYEEDSEELTFTAGNRLKEGLGSLRITKPMVYGITEQEWVLTTGKMNGEIENSLTVHFKVTDVSATEKIMEELGEEE